MIEITTVDYLYIIIMTVYVVLFTIVFTYPILKRKKEEEDEFLSTHKPYYRREQ